MAKISKTFWENEEQVNKFAAREPDLRFVELIKQIQNPEEVRVLDLGCAGGRNSVILAELGFDFNAVDASNAMVNKTIERVSAILGKRQANKRVHFGQMDNLSVFADERFHLILALGVFHNAITKIEWDRSLKESARILRSNGQILVSNFSSSSKSEGKELISQADEPNVYSGFGPGLLYLIEADELDNELTNYGLFPISKTETVITKTEGGQRVTINGLYRKK